ncbi:uncharacterized protein LOC111005696 [Momordica charantia]|uniref:Uncharacterized protein LOC111005696 n=1 Tax=Momordica charantia TaxID=3673 RepID=A0A6J1BTS9_MOMCH|nr:uncharacterized protein LOC111005696 [Momordica charantia]
MLLGKRPRPPIKRTASMTGITPDLPDVEPEEPSDQNHDLITDPRATAAAQIRHLAIPAQTTIANPRNPSPRDLVQPPPDHFLRTCGLCKRRLVAGRDIYMYRGDTAFCSSECREKQIKQDERREVYGAAGSKKKDERHAPLSTAAGRGSRKGQDGGGRL